jgi:hypothetical protein
MEKGGNPMRTTIEISDKHRGILLSLAAQKGLRGYSRVIEEAIDFYIEHHFKAVEIKRDALKMKGSWKEEDAGEIRTRLAELRKNWTQP